MRELEKCSKCGHSIQLHQKKTDAEGVLECQFITNVSQNGKNQEKCVCRITTPNI